MLDIENIEYVTSFMPSQSQQEKRADHVAKFQKEAQTLARDNNYQVADERCFCEYRGLSTHSLCCSVTISVLLHVVMSFLIGCYQLILLLVVPSTKDDCIISQHSLV